MTWLLAFAAGCSLAVCWINLKATWGLLHAASKLDDLNELVTERLAAVAVRESLETRPGGSGDEAAVTAMALTIAAESLTHAHGAMASAITKLDEVKRIHRSRTVPDDWTRAGGGWRVTGDGKMPSSDPTTHHTPHAT